ncbi:hypothetical protein ES707_02767 [subsurface metagenome]
METNARLSQRERISDFKSHSLVNVSAVEDCDNQIGGFNRGQIFLKNLLLGGLDGHAVIDKLYEESSIPLRQEDI